MTSSRKSFSRKYPEAARQVTSVREMQAGRAGMHVKATMLNQIQNPNLFWEALDLLLGAHGNFSIANTSQSLNQMSVLLEDSKPLMSPRIRLGYQQPK